METNDQITALLEELLRKCLVTHRGINVQTEADGIIRLNIAADEPALVIGKHAENLFALQQVFRILARKKLNVTEHLILDVDNYRKAQEDNAANIAREAARRARESGLPQELMPMPSYKRRAVHTVFLAPEYQGFRAFSVGEGEERRVRVELK